MLLFSANKRKSELVESPFAYSKYILIFIIFLFQKLRKLILKKVIKIMVPLMPNVGPCDGCLTHANTFFLRAAPRAWTRPMVVVLLPSPRGVGVILNMV